MAWRLAAVRYYDDNGSSSLARRARRADGAEALSREPSHIQCSEWPALARGTSGSSRERPDSRGVCVLVDRRERTTTATARSRAARDEQMAPRRQADSPRTSRWACARGASGSSRETRRPRVRRPRPTRDNDDSGSSRCEQMAPCRGANEAALAPRKGLAQGRTLLYGTSRTSGRPRSTWRPAACVTTTPIKRNQTAAARAPQAATGGEHTRTGKVPCKGPVQGSRAATPGLRAASEAARTPFRHRRRRRPLASRTTTAARARGAQRARGGSPLRTKQRAPAYQARGSRAAAPKRLAHRPCAMVTTAAVRASQATTTAAAYRP